MGHDSYVGGQQIHHQGQESFSEEAAAGGEWQSLEGRGLQNNRRDKCPESELEVPGTTERGKLAWLGKVA